MEVHKKRKIVMEVQMRYLSLRHLYSLLLLFIIVY